VKHITLSAEGGLIEAARERARAEHTTLNEQFRRWLEDYVHRASRVETAIAVIDRLQSYADTGGRQFSRDDMNQR
jgi:DNA mismatch repair ATPase MutS